MRKVDLNCDMGEGVGSDAALLDIVTSANIACGVHAGNIATMSQTIKLAKEKNVAIGVHPGFDDYANFGRTRMKLSHGELRDLIAYQIGAFRAVADINDADIAHLKLHGALANMTADDKEMAKICYGVALEILPQLKIFTIAQTEQMHAAQELGIAYVNEIFADRAYNDDASLVDRKLDHAVIHDAEFAADRICKMIDEQAIITHSGKKIPTKIGTICVHGDTAGAVDMARVISVRLDVQTNRKT